MRLFNTRSVSTKKLAEISAIKKLLSEQKGTITLEVKVLNEAGEKILSKSGPVKDYGFLHYLDFTEYNEE